MYFRTHRHKYDAVLPFVACFSMVYIQGNKRHFLMEKVLLDVLTEANEFLKKNLLQITSTPLACGNCGYVAIAMSKVLQKLNKDHFIRLYSYNIFDRNFTTWKECFDAGLSGDHLICIYKDTWLDFTLGCARKQQSIFLWDYQCLDIKDTNMDVLLEFCRANTTPWLEYNQIEDTIFQICKSRGIKI